MIPCMVLPEPAVAPTGGVEPHVLVVAREADTRFALASLLLEAGFRITAVPTFGVADLLRRAAEPLDVLVVAQSAEEIAWFGVPQLARSIDGDLPVVVLDRDTVASHAVVALVGAALRRWPLRDRPSPVVH